MLPEEPAREPAVDCPIAATIIRSFRAGPVQLLTIPGQAAAMVRHRHALVAAALLALGPSVAGAQSSLPDPARTPGAVNPAVTEANIDATICVPGWSHTIRPPREITDELKRRKIQQYGYADRRPSLYEEDHLVPLGLGGAPTDPRNLWPQPRDPPDGWSASKKDELEAALNHLVCAHGVRLDEAQHAMANNWHEAYTRFIGSASAAAAATAPGIASARSSRPATSCPNDRIVWVNTRSGRLPL